MPIPADSKQLNLHIKKYLHAKLTHMAKDNGVSLNFVVRRALLAVAESGLIPTVGQGYQERLSREKFGEEAVPTFDVERDEGKVPQDGRKDPIQPR